MAANYERLGRPVSPQSDASGSDNPSSPLAMFTKPIRDSTARAKLLPDSGGGGRTTRFSMPWTSRHAYSQVPSHDDDQDGGSMDFADENVETDLATPTRQRDSRSFRPSRANIIFMALLAVVAVLGGFGLGYTLAHRPSKVHVAEGPTRQKPQEKQCGSTPQEARDRGCIFEPQLSAWVPGACAFAELVTEYQDALGDMHSNPDWPWYWDRNLTQRVSAAEVPLLQAGNYTVIYTTYNRSHDLHCLYCWRKVSHALQHGFKMMDARCHQFFHAKHCAIHIGETLVRKEDEALEKWAYPLMYHDCVPLLSTEES